MEHDTDSDTDARMDGGRWGAERGDGAAEADDFEREVAILGGSDRFMQFLHERSQERATISLDEFVKTLS